jgi:hypothetical protein
LENKDDIERGLILGSDSGETVSSHSEGALDEDGRDGGGGTSGNQDKMLSRAQHIWNSGSVGTFACGLVGLKITRGNKNSILISSLLLLSMDMVSCRLQRPILRHI